MADVWNKVTHEFIESADTVEYETNSDWVIRPDISGVSGIDPSLWIEDTPGIIRQMTAAEYDAFHAPNLIQHKVAKVTELHARTLELLTVNGFDFAGSNFTLNQEAQANWDALLTAHNTGLLTFPLEVSKSDGTSYNIADGATLTMFCGTALGRVSQVYAEARPITASVWAAATKTALDAIVDTRT